MAKQVINRGSTPGDGTGEDLFVTFGKCISNFDELYQYNTDLGSASNGNGASMVLIEDSATQFTATNVEAALAELFVKVTDDVAAHETALTSNTNGNGAALVGVETGSGFTATDVQAALEELDTADGAIVSDLAATTTGNGAALIGVEAGTGFTATDVQAALVEIRTANGGGDATYTTLASNANGDGAALVGIEDPSGYISATTVEGAILELYTSKTAASILASGTNGQGASLVGIEDAGGNFTLTTVEGALTELAASAEAALPYPNGAQSSVASVAFTTTGSARVALPAQQTIRMHSTADCWIAFGDATVTVDGSTGMFFARGTEIIGHPTGDTYIAVRGELSIGALNMTGMDNTLTYELGDTVQLAYSAATNGVTLPANNGYIRVYSPTDCYIAFGGPAITSSTTTGTYFEAGTEILKVPTGTTKIAMVQYSIAASAYITGMN